MSTDDIRTDLAAEAITVRIRWFGLCVGFLLVNLIGRQTGDPLTLNVILAVGAVYAFVDTLWSLRGQVFLSKWPLLVSLMEAAFIGLLCNFDLGVDSPFRFFYFLSLLVCAMRYSPGIAYATYGLHAASYGALAFSAVNRDFDTVTTLLTTVVLMGWVTWASIALSNLLKRAGERLADLNDTLQRDQSRLEERIDSRTRELQESQAYLVQHEKQAAFGLLAAGIAHEVGNPLAAISSLVQMLNRKNPDSYTRERLEMVDDQLLRIQRTLRELVDFSRPASKQVSLCDVHDIIDDALSIAKYYKRKKGKRIVTRYADGLPKLRLVRDQLVQVFLNLILNAMDATDEGQSIEISTTAEDGRIRVAVRDEGCGIAAEDRQQLFRPYFTSKKSGTGLGLFVCRNIVEQSGMGEIELTSSSPEGTTFSVFLNAPTSEAADDADQPAVTVRAIEDESETL